MGQNESYVYILVDPETNDPDGFYVGKGTDYRDKAHLKPSAWSDPKNSVNPFLYFKIKGLMEKGIPPLIKRLAENLTDEQAYSIEHEYIKKHGRRFVDGGKLLNISDAAGGSCKGVSKPWSEVAKEAYRNLCKTMRKYDPSYEEMYEDFITNRKTRKQIANEHGCSDVLVKQRLHELGIKKPKGMRYPKKNQWVCGICARHFETPHSVHRKYCSRKCFFEARKLEND